MTPAGRIAAVIELLQEVLDTPRPADTQASAYFRNRRFIGSKDRQAISNRFYRVMREYIRLSWWVKKAGAEVNARTLVIASLILEKEHNPESLDASFGSDKFAPVALSKQEKKMAEQLFGNSLMSPDMDLQTRTECPDWAYESLKNALGDRFEDELNAMLTPAPLDIRVNSLMADRNEVLEYLKEEGLEAEAGKISPWSIRLFGRPPISQYTIYQDGVIEIQDEGSQMVALVADPKPGEQVVDFCAGAGGKTLALGAMMNNKGRIIAMDVLGKRLDRARERFRRAGLHNIETRALSSERDKYVKRHVGSFDVVLVDAPCSGTGTWRRDPDKRWRQLGPGLSSLVPLQTSILESASRMVKKGGRLVYATCSLLPEENDNQIRDFLKRHPEFEIKRIGDTLKMDGAGDFLHMSPARHNTDGFFAAVLIRNSMPAKTAGDEAGADDGQDAE